MKTLLSATLTQPVTIYSFKLDLIDSHICSALYQCTNGANGLSVAQLHELNKLRDILITARLTISKASKK